MPDFTPDLAKRILLERSRRQNDIIVPDPTNKRSCEYLFDGSNRRWMVVSQDRHENWVRIYINRQSRLLEWFPVDGPSSAFPCVEVGFRYLKGYKGRSGYPGIAASAARRPTLRPEEDHVLMLHCSSEAGFRELVRWYAGDISIGAGSPPSPDEVSGEGWFQTVTAKSPALTAIVSPTASDLPTPPSHTTSVGNSPTDAAAVAGHTQPAHDVEPPAATSSGQGWMQDPERRAAVEARAVALARLRYERMQYDVTERGKPYDLQCTPTPQCLPGSPEIHVEVKGSVGDAQSVCVTYNEVQHALEAHLYRTDLVCVSNIVLVQQSNGSWMGTEGHLAFIEEWRPADSDLQPTEYRYRLPAMSKG